MASSGKTLWFQPQVVERWRQAADECGLPVTQYVSQATETARLSGCHAADIETELVKIRQSLNKLVDRRSQDSITAQVSRIKSDVHEILLRLGSYRHLRGGPKDEEESAAPRPEEGVP